MRRTPSSGMTVGRGVWVAQWMGPDGETILVAVARTGRLVEQRMLRTGDGHVQAADEMWDALDRADPAPMLHVI